MSKTIGFLLVFVILSSVSPLRAQPTVAVTAASGTDAELFQVSLITHRGFWSHQFSGRWLSSAHLEFGVAQVNGRLSGANKGITVVGVTPVLRLEPEKSPGFFEFGIGANYFDQKTIHANKSVGTKFEFGDLIGFGVKLGEKKQVEVGYRLIHYSNAGISANNPGINFHQIRLQAGF
jgi:hypothetical protein